MSLPYYLYGMKVFLLSLLVYCALSIDLTTWELFEEDTVHLTIKDQIMWKLGSNILVSQGYGAFYWDEGTQQWVPNVGRCLILALSVDQLYCCNTGPNMYRKDNQGNSGPWTQFGSCYDVKVGGDNHVWFTTNTSATGGNVIGIYNETTTLTSTLGTGGAVKVAPTADGKAWIVTDTGDIKEWDGISWNSRPGSARDIIVGNDGIPFIVSTIPRNGAYEIMKWNDTQNAWETLEGIEGISMTLDNRNNPYIIAGNYSVYRPKGVLLNFCPSK